MIPAGEHFEHALALATDPATRARLQCQAASSLVATGDQRGVEYVREALTIFDPVSNPLETANALSIEGRFHHLAGRHKKAIELLIKAADLVGPVAESDHVSSFAAPIISQVYAYAAGAHQHYGVYDDANVWARRAVEFGTRHNIPFAQAVGYEFLGEDAVHSGHFEDGLNYGAQEREIAERLHSRERRAWTHLVVAQCSLFLGRLQEAEREYLAGIELAELIGERRVGALMRANYAGLQARTGRLDEALATALANLEQSGPNSLLYSRFEALRCLAEVRYFRYLSLSKEAKSQIATTLSTDSESRLSRETYELEEAARLCEEAWTLVTPTESRVSQLWLGPLHIEVLLAQGKREQAREKLSAYRELTSKCQSPRFSAEAKRLSSLLSN
jgi:tetratricopeptide (TPR) repeat protein